MFALSRASRRQPTADIATVHSLCRQHAHLPIRPLAIVCGGSKDSVSEFKAGVCPTGALVRRPPALVPSAPPAGTLLPPLLPPPSPDCVKTANGKHRAPPTNSLIKPAGENWLRDRRHSLT